MPAQTLRPKDDKAERTEIKLPPGLEMNNITQIGLLVETSDKFNVPGLAAIGEHDNIIIQCTYTISLPSISPITLYKTFSLTPELYAIELANYTEFANASQATFKAIFNEPEIADEQMVVFNTVQQSSEGSWFSFDYKGGSFLCKPDVGILSPEWPKPLKGNSNSLPEWSMIDAAVQLPNRRAFFFKNDPGNTRRSHAQTYLASAAAFPGPLAGEEYPIQRDWGKVNNNLARTGIVNAAYVDRRTWKTYLFSGDQYVVYSDGMATNYEWVDEGYPQPLSNNLDLPQWSQIDAIFQGKDGKTYFFNNTEQTYCVSDLSTERNIRDDWGTVTNSSFITGFTPPPNDPGAPAVDAGFVYNNATYLINRNEFIRYTDSDYRFIDVGYLRSCTIIDKPSLAIV